MKKYFSIALSVLIVLSSLSLSAQDKVSAVNLSNPEIISTEDYTKSISSYSLDTVNSNSESLDVALSFDAKNQDVISSEILPEELPPVEEILPIDLVKYTVIVTETKEYYQLNNNARIWQFGKNGLNNFYSLDGHILVENEQFIAIRDGIEQIPITVNVIHYNIDDTYYISETYTCNDGLEYTSVYSLSYGSTLMVECLVTSEKSVNVELEWRFENNSTYKLKENKVSFDNGISFYWDDVEKSLGKITKLDIKEKSSKQKISFDIGAISKDKPKLLDPGVGGIEIYWVNNGGNWSDNTTHWSTISGGAADARIPTSVDDVNFDAASFNTTLQVVTVDATAYCYDLDFTGVTNTPTLAGTTGNVDCYGSLTLIAAMFFAYGAEWIMRGNTAGLTVTTAGLTLGTCNFYFTIGAAGVYTLQDDLTLAANRYFRWQFCGGTFNSNNKTITASSAYLRSPSASAIINLGSSIINCLASGWTADSGGTLNSDTSSIRLLGTGNFIGGGYSYNEVQLNGTAHTVSGSNTFVNLIRNGTATKTNSVTFTSGTTQTVTGTCDLIGNSATNRLLVQSSTLGSPATIHATAWTNTNACDFMDITSTDAVDFSAGGLNPLAYVGDCGGNTNITFTAAATQTWDGATASWDEVAHWTSRVPLPQDDVSAGGAANTITVDMPRIGASITFTGTPVVTKTNGIEIFGSFTLASGMTYGGAFDEFFRGRSNYFLTSNGKSIYRLRIYAPNGLYTLSDSLVASVASFNYLLVGGFDSKDYNVNLFKFDSFNNNTRNLILGSGIWTINNNDAAVKWNISSTGLTFDAGTSTIILTNSGANAQTFAGGGLTYNNVTVAGAGNYALTVTGSNTFNNFAVDRSENSKTILFTDGTKQTVNNFTCTTNSTAMVTMNGTGVAGWEIEKSGGGTINLDYMNINDSTGSPASTWYYGQNCVVSNLTGWNTVPFRYWVGDTGNWPDYGNHWSSSSGGLPDLSNTVNSTTCVRFDSNSFTAGAQTVTINATAYCLDMDWTGALNNPTLAGASELDCYGDIIYIAAMLAPYTGNLVVSGATFRNYILPITINSAIYCFTAGATLNILTNNLVSTKSISWRNGAFVTNDLTISCTSFYDYSSATAKTLTLGASTINCTAWSFGTGGLTLTANTATIKITGNGDFAGGGITTYNEVQLNGTAHTVSGNNTFVNLIRNGTAAKTDSVTFSDNQTVTGNFAVYANSATNRVLVQSDILGTSYNITANSITVADGVDFMDISGEGTGNWDISSNLTGDCGGNIGITFATAVAQTWDGTTGSWSDVTKWTSRVPLPQDEVSAGGAANTITVDMPRVGGSVTFTGTPVVTLSNDVSNYGSYTLVAGMTYTPNSKYNYFRGRGVYTFASGGETYYAISIYAPTGSYTMQDNLTLLLGIYLYNGTLDINDNDILTNRFDASGSAVRTLFLGNGTITVTDTAALAKWNLATVTNLTFDAEGSTIILTSTLTNSQTFAGGSQVYHDVTIQGNGTYQMTITGDNIFNTLAVNRDVAAKIVLFAIGTVTTVSSLSIPVSGATVVTMNSTTTGGWSLVDYDGGFFTSNFLDIANSAATPANTWYAGVDSTDRENNSGWIFSTPPAPSVNTIGTSNVTSFYALLSGNITASYGAEQRGFQWGLVSGMYTSNVSENGTYDIGLFSNAASPLDLATQYFFRAFAANPWGVGYGGELTFITVSILPFPPTNFTIIDLNDKNTTANMTWAMGLYSTNITLVGKKGSYPVDRTDGYILTVSNITQENDSPLNLLVDQYFFRIWSENAVGYSADYAEGYIGGTSMLQSFGWVILLFYAFALTLLPSMFRAFWGNISLKVLHAIAAGAGWLAFATFMLENQTGVAFSIGFDKNWFIFLMLSILALIFMIIITAMGSSLDKNGQITYKGLDSRNKSEKAYDGYKEDLHKRLYPNRGVIFPRLPKRR